MASWLWEYGSAGLAATARSAHSKASVRSPRRAAISLIRRKTAGSSGSIRSASSPAAVASAISLYIRWNSMSWLRKPPFAGAASMAWLIQLSAASALPRCRDISPSRPNSAPLSGLKSRAQRTACSAPSRSPLSWRSRDSRRERPGLVGSARRSISSNIHHQRLKIIRPLLGETGRIGDISGGFGGGHWSLPNRRSSRLLPNPQRVLHPRACRFEQHRPVVRNQGQALRRLGPLHLVSAPTR